MNLCCLREFSEFIKIGIKKSHCTKSILHPARFFTLRQPGGSILLILLSAVASGDWAQTDAPEIPRIESVRMLEKQPLESDPAVIWYDDFNGPEKDYTESSGGLDSANSFGKTGKSMPCLYLQGSQGQGNRKVFFGDSPTGKVVKPGKKFPEIYWRIYVKHQYGWTGGGPAKMSRGTSIVSAIWNQAMIAHVWSSGESLTLDPASGVVGDKVVTTTYNDFNNLHWLGNKPISEFKISSTAESGWWVCVEARARLNTPGKADGINQLWIDGRLECERRNLDWVGSYIAFGINAVFLEAYWNDGSPVTQTRWYDNFVISTQPIGPVITTPNPTLYKTPYHGPGTQSAWKVELATDTAGTHVVWRSKILNGPDSVRVDGNNGVFEGILAGKSQLADGARYFTRVCQESSSGTWSDWSRWHQPFITEVRSSHSSPGCDFNGDEKVNLADVIGLLLFQRDHPGDNRGDYNQDGSVNITDAVRLLLDMVEGKCLFPVVQLAQAVNLTSGVVKIEGLTQEDCRYLEKSMNQLPLTPPLQEAFLQALYGENSRIRMPGELISLSQNSPNPFNPRTAITFKLPSELAPAHVTLKIFDLRNELVRILVDEPKDAGLYTVYWDGTDENGTQVASGVYLYRMETRDFTQTRKMVLLR